MATLPALPTPAFNLETLIAHHSQGSADELIACIDDITEHSTTCS